MLLHTNSQEEIWKDIKGFEGLYKVSNKGNIYSLYSNKILKWKTNNRGYHSIGLYKNGKVYYRLIHRLVAEHFVPNPNNYPQVNHKDENKSNNCADNLEWCTNHYNALYGTRIERTVNNKSYKRSRDKLKRKVVGRSLDGKKVIYLDSIAEGRKYGFDPPTITNVCKGKYKHHKGFVWEYVD